MDQILDDNMYIIDLSGINTAPEIIFELSSILDNDEAKNRRICLKLGSVDLNQAQLLSIKSLINSIDSILSSIDTKSVQTEKVALSLGIIISNVSSENSIDVLPTKTYKTAEELKEELQSNTSDSDKEDVIIEEETTSVEDNENQSKEEVQESNQEQILEEQAEESSSEEQIQEPNEIQDSQENIDDNNNVKDELDVIFGSNSERKSIFEIDQPADVYEESDELTDIVVPEQEYTKEDIELEGFPTKYIKQTIRSGQVINYEGNIVIIGDCHPGCEVTAFGDITVWGVLSGIAHAGSGGNQKARVRALKMNAIQLRIANCYSRRPDSMNTVYIEKTDSFTPEEARIINGEIVVFKMND